MCFEAEFRAKAPVCCVAVAWFLSVETPPNAAPSYVDGGTTPRNDPKLPTMFLSVYFPAFSARE